MGILKRMRKNKLFTVFIILTILFSLIGILLPAVMDDDTKKEITNQIIELDTSIKEGRVSVGEKGIILRNLLLVNAIWFIGISVIGIPILLLFYVMQVLLTFSEFSFLIINLRHIKAIFIPIYLFPRFLNLVFYFLLVYYAIHYSLFLIRFLFLKGSFSVREMHHRYLKILFFGNLFILISSILEVYVIPKILTFSL